MKLKIVWSKVSSWLNGASLMLIGLGLAKLLFAAASPVMCIALIWLGVVLGVVSWVERDDPDSS